MNVYNKLKYAAFGIIVSGYVINIGSAFIHKPQDGDLEGSVSNEELIRNSEDESIKDHWRQVRSEVISGDAEDTRDKYAMIGLIIMLAGVGIGGMAIGTEKVVNIYGYKRLEGAISDAINERVQNTKWT